MQIVQANLDNLQKDFQKAETWFRLLYIESRTWFFNLAVS